MYSEKEVMLPFEYLDEMTDQLHKDPVIITKLKAILDENLENERFGVSELCDAVGLSRSSLHRKVHAYNGNSTSQFIREYRLQKAMELLLEEELTASEIAYSVGFSSPTYFNTSFKAYYGYPPGEAKLRNHTSFSKQPEIRDKGGRLLRRWVVILTALVVVISVLAASYYFNTRSDKRLAISERTLDKSIAVLPFQNWSGDPELDYISDGMTDAIITRLNVVDSLKVIPFASVLKYKTFDLDAPSIAKQLGVENILQGNFQRFGDQLKITMHLIHGPSNSSIASKVYSGEWNLAEIFKIQTNVAESVVDELQINMNDQTLQSIRQNPTENREAYFLWLRGNHQMYKYTDKGFKNAITLYKEAIELDTTFFKAHVSLAYLYLFGGASWGMYTEQEAWLNAKDHLSKALALDSTDINVIRGYNDGLYIYEWDFENMEKEYWDKSNISWIYSIQTGKFEEVLARIDKTIAENPMGYMNQVFKIQTLYHLKRIEEAKSLLEQLEPLYDDEIMFLRLASKYYYYMGEHEKSKVLLTRLLDQFPDRPPVVIWLAAVHAAREGNKELEKEYVTDLTKRYEDYKSGSPAFFTALYYCDIGDYENAFLWLENAYDRHEAEMIWLREHPILRPIRSDPRYIELYHKIGFPMPPHAN